MLILLFSLPLVIVWLITNKLRYVKTELEKKRTRGK